ncbi:MAG: NAD(P)H-hydrate dehydratase [Candidatus Dormibacteria bacterium]
MSPASAPQLGVDVVAVDRITRLLERRPGFSDRVYTAAEQAECAGRPERWASRWAVKEAVRKLHGAASLPLPGFRDVETLRARDGVPRVSVHGTPAELAVSISHDAGVVVAVAAGTPAATAHVAVPAILVLAPRPAEAHKGSFGTVAVIGGCVGFSGAPLMSATAAARSGAGLTRLYVPEAVWAVVAAQTLEVMTHPLPSEDGGLAAAAVAGLRVQLGERVGAVVLGPGAGRAPATERVVLDLLAGTRIPLVVDADALNIAAAAAFEWRRCTAPVVVTPHPAEMARLAGTDTASVQADRVATATGFARSRGAVVVLKGAGTVVAAPDGRTWTAEIRTVALAAGGSGDVLSGMVAAFIAQGLDPFDAAVAAVVVHGEAGTALERRRGRAGVLARDLLEELPAAQERVRRVVEGRARS